MPKKLDLTDNLEKYIIEHSDNLTDIQIPISFRISINYDWFIDLVFINA